MLYNSKEKKSRFYNNEENMISALPCKGHNQNLLGYCTLVSKVF